jgi:hypothetical protein
MRVLCALKGFCEDSLTKLPNQPTDSRPEGLIRDAALVLAS